MKKDNEIVYYVLKLRHVKRTYLFWFMFLSLKYLKICSLGFFRLRQNL